MGEKGGQGLALGSKFFYAVGRFIHSSIGTGTQPRLRSTLAVAHRRLACCNVPSLPRLLLAGGHAGCFGPCQWSGSFGQAGFRLLRAAPPPRPARHGGGASAPAAGPRRPPPPRRRPP